MLPLYLYALQKMGRYYYGEEENLFRLQGPDGRFDTGYDLTEEYAGAIENAETTSIVMIAISFGSLLGRRPECESVCHF